MAPSDPPSADPDEAQEAARLRAFFSAASAKHLADDAVGSPFARPEAPAAPAPEPPAPEASIPAPDPDPEVPAPEAPIPPPPGAPSPVDAPALVPVQAHPAEPIGDRPPPAGQPVLDTSSDAAEAPLDPHASVDLARLIAYLDAQLELTRRRADEGVAKILASLASMEGRLAELETFRSDLFEWLEAYVGWEAVTLAEIAGRVSTAPGALPTQPQDDANPT